MRANQFVKNYLSVQPVNEIDMRMKPLQKFIATDPRVNELITGFEIELNFNGIEAGMQGVEDERISSYTLFDDLRTAFSDYVSYNNRGYRIMEDDYLEARDEKIDDELSSRRDEVTERARELAEENLNRDDIEIRIQAIIDSLDIDEKEEIDKDEIYDKASQELIDESYEEYMDEAEEEVKEDIRDSLDYDFGEWLYDNFRYYSDVAEAYDLEVPFGDYDEDSSFNENKMYTAGKDLSKLTGLRVEVTSNNDETPTGEIVIKPDASLQPDSGDSAAEIATPPLSFNVTMKVFDDVIKWAENYGAYSNNKTGFHFNISRDGESSNFSYLKMLLMLGDEFLLDQFDRLDSWEGQKYARSSTDKLLTYLNNPDTDKANNTTYAQSILQELRNNMLQRAEQIAQHIMTYGQIQNTWFTAKFISLNWKQNYLEVRSMGGPNMLSQIKEIKAGMYRIARAYVSATSPEMDRAEYLKKLYVLITNSIETSKISNDISLKDILSRYITGDRTKAPEIIQKLRSRLERQKLSRQTDKMTGMYKPKLPQYNPNKQLDLDFGK